MPWPSTLYIGLPEFSIAATAVSILQPFYSHPLARTMRFSTALTVTTLLAVMAAPTFAVSNHCSGGYTYVDLISHVDANRRYVFIRGSCFTTC